MYHDSETAQYVNGTGHTPVQRWSRGRTRFRLPDNLFNPARHEAVVLSETDAKEFCRAHHYSGSMPASRFRVGLIRRMPFTREVLAGVAVFSVPMQAAVLKRHLGADMTSGAELGRFVLLDDVEYNGESWFIGAANRLLRRETPIRSVVCYSDPVARVTESGECVKPGHQGTIYQSTGSRFVGRSSPRTLVLTPGGLVISGRTLSKIRNGETGSQYAYQQLLAAGAPVRRIGEEPADYVRRALAEGPFIRRRHPGNWVYCYGVGSRAERSASSARFAPSLPYPKAGANAVDPIILGVGQPVPEPA